MANVSGKTVRCWVKFNDRSISPNRKKIKHENKKQKQKRAKQRLVIKSRQKTEWHFCHKARQRRTANTLVSATCGEGPFTHWACEVGRRSQRLKCLIWFVVAISLLSLRVGDSDQQRRGRSDDPRRWATVWSPFLVNTKKTHKTKLHKNTIYKTIKHHKISFNHRSLTKYVQWKK